MMQAIPLSVESQNEFAFMGFNDPKENWSKLPHELIAALPTIKTLSELKIILYVLRHTWGYQDESKRITIDEFMHGRKRRDGTRIDNGVGMSEQAVRDGIENAITNGFITVETDNRDAARIKKYYALKIAALEPEAGSNALGSKVYTPDPQSLDPRPLKFRPRTEKETIERNFRIENTARGAAQSPPPPNENGQGGVPDSSSGGELEGEDFSAAAPAVKSPTAGQLDPELPDEEYLFEKVNAERAARKLGKQKRFRTTAQRGVFRECIQFFNGKTRAEIDRQFALGKNTLDAVVNGINWRREHWNEILRGRNQGQQQERAPVQQRPVETLENMLAAQARRAQVLAVEIDND